MGRKNKQKTFEQKVIKDARWHLEKYLNENHRTTPRLGIYYFKGKWKRILRSFDKIVDCGKKNNLKVELAGDGTHCVYYEYIFYDKFDLS